MLGLLEVDAFEVLRSIFKNFGLLEARIECISLLALTLGGGSLLLGGTGVLHGVASLPSGNHDLEALEISELLSFGISLHLLVGTTLGPLLVEIGFLSFLGESASSGGSLDRNNDGSQGESSKWVNNSWELLLGMVDQDTVGIEDIDNNAHLAIVFAVVDEANSTWFNEIFKTL